MTKYELIGIVINGVTVLSIRDDGKYECKCHCGKQFIAAYPHLTRKDHQIKSCGCTDLRMIDLIGKKFGRLIVISKDPLKRHENLWNCKCDCGKDKLVRTGALLSGFIKSCGCLRKESSIYNALNGDYKRRNFELNGYRFKSGFEFLYAEHLTSLGIKWSYETKTFPLGNTSYTPDFFLEETNEYVEVNGYFWPKSKEKVIKLEKDYGIKVKIILMADILKIKPDYDKWIKSIPIESDSQWIDVSSSDPLTQIQVTYSSDDS
jgi:hypothetical protein